MSDSRLGSVSNIPVPDPSVVTTERLIQLREEFERAILARAATVDVRLDNLDKLLEREGQRLERIIDDRLQAINEIVEGFRRRLIDMAERRVLDLNNAKDSTAQSLQFIKDLIGLQNNANASAIVKMEAASTKEIDGLKILLNTMREGIGTEVRNLAGRLDRGEGGTLGARQTRDEGRANTTTVVGVVGGIAGALLLVATVYFNSSQLTHDKITSTGDATAQRLSDVVSLTNEQNRQMTARLDALSARLNALTGAKPSPP